MQRTKSNQGNLGEENKAGGFTVSYIKIHYKTILIRQCTIDTRMDKQANEQYRGSRNRSIHM